MNRPIVRIYIFVLALFAFLVAFTSRWSVFEADDLEAKTANRRPLIEQQQVPRGDITTADGVLIAQSLPEGGGKHPPVSLEHRERGRHGCPRSHSERSA